ncbi:hypothetical protein BASA83_007035 [Batrachochytrium salamandrivorans]|nr:hypothetical protein BASA83_007035 [Batrachochytrium salamandrivorans]
MVYSIIHIHQSPITNPDINRSIPNTLSLHTSITSYIHTIPSTPKPSAEIRHQRSKYALETYIPMLGQVQIGCSYVQANHASSAKIFALAGPQYWPGHRASLLSLAHCGGLWDYPRALKAGLLHPTANRTPTSWAVPACVSSVMLTWTASPWPTWW